MNCFIDRTVGEFDFHGIWQRLQDATGLQSLSQLASILGVKQPTVSKAKKQGTFPLKWALCIAKIYFLNADWVLYGTGPIRQGRIADTLFDFKLDKLKDVLGQATRAGSTDEYETCLEVAEKLREEIILEARLTREKKNNIHSGNESALDPDPEIARLMEGARRVLKSGNSVAFDALERNIKYFDYAIRQEREMAEQKKKLVEMEKRLAALEEKKNDKPPTGEVPSSRKKVA